MIYSKGDRVRHPKIESWGIGLVLEDSDETKVRIFFAGVGEKVISLNHVAPLKVIGEEAESAVLDNLKIDSSRPNVSYRSLPSLMAHFLQEFPGGFDGDRFRRHERDHKDEISKLVKEQLSHGCMSELLKAGNHREICDRALKLTAACKNAMIFKNEKMALRDGLKTNDAAEAFAKSLFCVLHGTGDFDERFQSFAGTLQDIGAGKWTNATYFPFFMYPDKHMFVKPTITQNASDVCAFEINYRPEVNAKTYKSVIDFSVYLKNEIAALNPSDMIDVQSFMWCVAPGTYGIEAVLR